MTNANQNNVASITDKQASPACRFTIQASLRGFPVTIEGEGRAGDLKIIVDRLLAAGAEPPSSAKPEPTKPAGAPICPVHRTPMKEGRRGFFCPKKTGDGYCTETA